MYDSTPDTIANYLLNYTKSLPGRKSGIVWVALDHIRFPEHLHPTNTTQKLEETKSVAEDNRRKPNQSWKREEVKHLETAIKMCSLRPPYWIAETVFSLNGLPRHTIGAIWAKGEELMRASNPQPTKERILKNYTLNVLQNANLNVHFHVHLF
ncbi:hypothetical protein DdX_19179 [Ditylenchus destructor]|uniref:Uncharacterized protein n=1 Tax=Ditylenchus destructor TaxID=166010 RepID=A0AAD4MN43_9BILA|nr:hypothetical protein DdX_19179 [Ditylenchus destructor]